MEAKKQIKDLEKQVKLLKKTLASSSSSSSSSSQKTTVNYTEETDRTDTDDDSGVFYHQYSLSTIFVAVQQVITAGHSYRSTANSLELFSSFSNLGSPHFTTIKSWVERLGLYELTRPKQKRDDWIFIADFTVELGQEKAFVIYGIPHKYWLHNILPQRRALKHTDGQILALEITTSPTGEWVQSVLNSVSSRVGIPFQIISDHASNLKKDIQLFQSHHPSIIYTYDLTHAMAKLLEKELFADELFPNFLSDCHQCRLEIQQTEFAFATPPPQRSKSRFFNLDPLLRWATTLVSIPLLKFFKLLPNYHRDRISRRFFAKFSWLFRYQRHIKLWSLLLHMTRSLETLLKTYGLNSASIYLYHQYLSSLHLPSSFLPFQHQIFHYLHSQLPSHISHTILPSSDILESLFGRYKHFSQRSPLQELRSLLLTIPLSTVNLTKQFIHDALTTITNSDLSQWVDSTFGQSMLSKRNSLFSNNKFS